MAHFWYKVNMTVYEFFWCGGYNIVTEQDNSLLLVTTAIVYFNPSFNALYIVCKQYISNDQCHLLLVATCTVH
jgi:hypothetical protein